MDPLALLGLLPIAGGLLAAWMYVLGVESAKRKRAAWRESEEAWQRAQRHERDNAAMLRRIDYARNRARRRHGD